MSLLHIWSASSSTQDQRRNQQDTTQDNYSTRHATARGSIPPSLTQHMFASQSLPSSGARISGPQSPRPHVTLFLDDRWTFWTFTSMFNLEP